MKGLLKFLREHPVAWMLPIGVFLAVVAWLAWDMANTPADPFAYRAN